MKRLMLFGVLIAVLAGLGVYLIPWSTHNRQPLILLSGDASSTSTLPSQRDADKLDRPTEEPKGMLFAVIELEGRKVRWSLDEKSGATRAIAFTSDGKQILRAYSRGRNGTMEYWFAAHRLDDGKLLWEIDVTPITHDCEIVISPGDHRAALLVQQKGVSVIDLDRRSVLAVWEGPNDHWGKPFRASQILWGPRGERLLIPHSLGQVVHELRGPSWNEFRSFSLPQYASVGEWAFTPDEQQIVVHRWARVISLGSSDLKVLRRWPKPEDDFGSTVKHGISEVWEGPDNALKQELQAWDLELGGALGMLLGPQVRIHGYSSETRAWSGDRSRFVCAENALDDNDCGALVFDAVSGELWRAFAWREGRYTRYALDNRATHLAVAFSFPVQKEISLGDLTIKGEEGQHTWKAHEGMIRAAGMCAQGKIAWSIGMNDGHTYLWELPSGQKILEIKSSLKLMPRPLRPAVEMSPDGTQYLVNEDGTWHCREIATGKVMASYPGRSLQWVDWDERWIFLDHQVFSLDSGSPLFSLPELEKQGKGIRLIAVSSSSKAGMVATLGPNAVRLFRTLDWRPARTLTFHLLKNSAFPTAVAFSPNGRFLACWGSGNSEQPGWMYFWDLKNGTKYEEKDLSVMSKVGALFKPYEERNLETWGTAEAGKLTLTWVPQRPAGD